MNPEPVQASRRGPRVAHTAWAIVGVVVCLLLVLTGQQGHPPAVIFLPIALVAWAVGHGLIWVVVRLAATGRRVAARAAAEGQAWPLGLRLAAICTGAAALVGVAQVVGTVLTGKWYPFQHAGPWAAMLAVWLLHAICFAGLLLRRSWSRLLGAALAVGWSALLGAQLAAHLGPGWPASPAELAMALGLVITLLLFGAYLAASANVRSFLRH